MINKVELLAPAGSKEALFAAVENGADAVYLGGKLFNARQQADNFDTEVLKEVLDYSHVRGVNIYLALNTLIYDNEIKQALELAAEAREAGIDGIIVQDIGLARALRRIMPDVPLHGSTQMTIYDVNGAKALEDMGFKRVVTARELTLEEISEIVQKTSLAVEIFVHGALCVCYSGQCLMSSIIGGRSGNRGRCAQPCRLPYKLIEQGSGKPVQPTGKGWHGANDLYLLSPKDICALDLLDEIVASGVRSLKIEGRMKSPEYVATVVRIYRKYLDMALKKYDEGTGNKSQKPKIEYDDMHDLLQAYNRGGFSQGYLKGKTGADMMSFEKPNNSGIYLGSVIAFNHKENTVRIRLEDKLSVGDGVEIWTGGHNSPGGTVSQILKLDEEIVFHSKKKTASLAKQSAFRRDYSRFGKPAMVKAAEKGDLVEIGSFTGSIAKGAKIYKTLDVELNKAARESYTRGCVKRIPITGHAVLRSGEPFILCVSDEEGHIATARSKAVPEPAKHKPVTEDRIGEQLIKTGSTPLVFSKLEIEAEEGLSIAVSEINEVRRKALDSLLELRANRYEGRQKDSRITELISEVAEHPLAEDLPQAEKLSGKEKSHLSGRKALFSIFFYKWNENIDYSRLGADRIYLPLTSLSMPEFNKKADSARRAGTEIFVWLPSITRGNYSKLADKFDKKFMSGSADGFKPESDGKYGIDGVLVGNIGTVRRFRNTVYVHQGSISSDNLKLAGDIALNIFNSCSLYEAARMGLDSAALSVELTLKQVRQIAVRSRDTTEGLNMPDIEVVVYGRLPLMTSEYCPVGCTEGGFAAKSACSGCCSRGDYKLRDRMGKEFPVLCDRIDCKSTILNSDVLFVPEAVSELAEAGVGLFRLYIWDESQEEIEKLVKLYKAAATGKDGEMPEFRELVENIRARGFTKGHYYRGV